MIFHEKRLKGILKELRYPLWEPWEKKWCSASIAPEFRSWPQVIRGRGTQVLMVTSDDIVLRYLPPGHIEFSCLPPQHLLGNHTLHLLLCWGLKKTASWCSWDNRKSFSCSCFCAWKWQFIMVWRVWSSRNTKKNCCWYSHCHTSSLLLPPLMTIQCIHPVLGEKLSRKLCTYYTWTLMYESLMCMQPL